MPFYDYKCSDIDCGRLMESKLQKFSDKIIECDVCKQQTAVQQFSGKFAAHGLPNGHSAVRVTR